MFIQTPLLLPIKKQWGKIIYLGGEMLNFVDLGQIEYSKALEIQHKLHDKRKNGEIEDTLLLLEHFPVITLGVRGEYNNIYLPKEQLKKQGIEIFEVNRGGDVTYHGIGQVVGYPIMDLKTQGGDIKQFVFKMEQSIIKFLKDKFSINAYIDDKKYTGVWVVDEKIAAIGIEAKKWVTMHGFALNINTNLLHFDFINPCGLSKGVTSVEKIIGETTEIDEIKPIIAQYFANEHGKTIRKVNLSDLLDEETI